MRRFTLALALLLACGGAPPPAAPTVAASSAPSRATPDPCELAAGLRREVPTFVRAGRLQRVLRVVSRADALCPASAGETTAAREAAQRELARSGDPDELHAQANAARKAGDAPAAHVLDDRALAELERHAGAPPSAHVRSALQPFQLVPWLPDGVHAVILRDDGASVVNVDDGRTWGPFPTARAVTDIEISGDGAQIALAEAPVAGRPIARVIDWRENRVVAELPLAGGLPSVGPLQSDPGGKLLAYGTFVDGGRVGVGLWDWSARRTRSVVAAPGVDPRSSWLLATAFSGDGARLAASWQDGTLGVFETANGKTSFSRKVGPFRSLVFDPRGEWLAWYGDGALGAVHVRTGRMLRVRDRTECKPALGAFDPTGRSLVTTDAGGKVVCRFDLATSAVRVVWKAPPPGRPVRAASEREVPVARIELREGRTVALVRASAPTILVDLASGRLLPSPPLAAAAATGWDLAGMTSDGRLEVRMASVPAMHLVASDTSTGQELWQLPLEGGFGFAQFSPDARRVLVTDSRLRVVDARTGAARPVPSDAPPPAPFERFAFDAAGGTLSFAMRSGAVTRFDAATGELLGVLAPPAADVSARVDPRPYWVGTRNAALWLDGRRVELPKSNRTPDISALSPDATRFAAFGDLTTLPPPRTYGVRVWDTSGRLLAELAGHSNPVGFIVFSPDGRTLATATDAADTSLRLWDVTTGTETHVLLDLPQHPGSLVFAPRGELLAASVPKGGVMVFDTASGQVVGSIATDPESTVVRLAPSDAEQVWTLGKRALSAWTVSGAALRTIDLGVDAHSGAFVPGRDLFALEVESTLTTVGAGELRLYSTTSGKAVLTLHPVVGAAVAIAEGGGVEILGDPEAARVALTCRVAGRTFEFQVCEDRVVEEGVIARVMAPPR